MALIKKENGKGTYEVSFRINTKEGTKQIHRRGFKTQKEAKEFISNYTNYAHDKIDMKFKDFYYKIYHPHHLAELKENTMQTKQFIFDKKILPVFGELSISDINRADILKWQHSLTKEGFSPTYLRTINNQLSTVLNYAEVYFDGYSSPHKKVKSMGAKKGKEKVIWTIEEFDDFLAQISDKHISYVIFQILFYTGCRLGELLALEVDDFNFEAKTMKINKSFQRINRRDVITPPKTEESNRIVNLPTFLNQAIKEYVDTLPYDKGRLFPVTKSFVEHEMKRGIKLSGNRPTNIHALRHSCISYLIYRGVPLIEIQELVGHAVFSNITLKTYTHVYGDGKRRIANLYDNVIKEKRTDRND